MFVRVTWNTNHPTAVGRPWRRLQDPGRKSGLDDLGVAPCDFAKLTKSLFDKQG